MHKKLMSLIVMTLFLATATWAAPEPDTGQTKCYDETDEIPCPQPGEPFYGQDAQYGTNAHSYTDLENGIIRDNVTGLEWVQDGKLMATRDPGFDNDDTADDGRVTWQHARDYVETLNNEYYLGYNDWRMPGIHELDTLVDSSVSYPGPTIDTTFFPGTPGSWYWSSTPSSGLSAYKYYVDFGSGWLNNFGDSSWYYVRAVRSGQSNNNFVDNLDGTVTDTASGLMWQQAPAGTKTWEQALTYCETLALAGHDD
jgi:hypothetical protein